MLKNPYWRLMRFDRPIGTYLLLWPTLWAVWIAGHGAPSMTMVLIFALGVIIMRAAGSVINDIADRHIDGHVKRTVQRPLATGELSTKQALGVFIALLSAAAVLVMQLNWLTWGMAAIGAGLAVLYPFSKRVFPMPQLVLGLVWSWGILMAFTAQTGQIPLVAILLYSTHLCLTVAYDTMYAMVDRDDDIHLGIHSTALLFGRFDKAIVAVLQITVIIFLLLIGLQQTMNHYYFLAVLVAAGFFLYQQYLIRNRERADCLQAFLNNQWVGLSVLIGIMLGLN